MGQIRSSQQPTARLCRPLSQLMNRPRRRMHQDDDGAARPPQRVVARPRRSILKRPDRPRGAHDGARHPFGGQRPGRTAKLLAERANPPPKRPDVSGCSIRPESRSAQSNRALSEAGRLLFYRMPRGADLTSVESNRRPPVGLLVRVTATEISRCLPRRDPVRGGLAWPGVNVRDFEQDELVRVRHDVNLIAVRTGVRQVVMVDRLNRKHLAAKRIDHQRMQVEAPREDAFTGHVPIDAPQDAGAWTRRRPCGCAWTHANVRAQARRAFAETPRGPRPARAGR